MISMGENQRELPSDSTLIIVALSFYRLTCLLSHSMPARAIIVFLVANMLRVWLMFIITDFQTGRTTLAFYKPSIWQCGIDLARLALTTVLRYSTKQS